MEVNMLSSLSSSIENAIRAPYIYGVINVRMTNIRSENRSILKPLESAIDGKTYLPIIPKSIGYRAIKFIIGSRFHFFISLDKKLLYILNPAFFYSKFIKFLRNYKV